MLRIATACGSGLGSSFMVEMNIKKILLDNNIERNQVQVNHYDLGSAAPDKADVWVVGKDLEKAANHLGDVRVLNSIIDMNELRTVVNQILEEKELI